MYLKLSIRNAKRSFIDYLLYIAAMTTLLSVMEISLCIAISGESSGFQTASLPIIIVIILIILVSFIDQFMLRQRAKEFASYLLLGMEKSKLTNLFLLEFFLIGSFCFVAGTTLGFLIYATFCSFLLTPTAKPLFSLYGQSLLHCLFYFCLVEIVCAFHLKRRLGRLQILELMHENSRPQAKSIPTQIPHIDRFSQKIQGIALGINLTCFITFVLGITFLPEKHTSVLVSIIAIPLLISIFTFYRWLLTCLYVLRHKQTTRLYQNNRLYLVAKLTVNLRTDARLNATFCICLLFSSMAFFTGILMLQPEICLFDRNTQLWMGTAQICLCVIFLIIYFFLLSLRQIMKWKHSVKDITILHSIGKDKKQLQKLVNTQICIGLTLPMFATIPILVFCIPLLNRKLNYILTESLHNILLKSSGYFFLCILIFYFCFYGIVNTLTRE